MKEFEKKLQEYIKNNDIDAQHLVFEQSCHSVAEAAQAVNGSPEDFVKNICLVTPDDQLVVAIVKGEDRVDLAKVGEVVGVEKVKRAKPNQVLEKSGYPCGGVPSFGYEAIFLIDERVMLRDIVYTGGGSDVSLCSATPHELVRANAGKIVAIAKGVEN